MGALRAGQCALMGDEHIEHEVFILSWLIMILITCRCYYRKGFIETCPIIPK
jgi:hypothetical protein